MTDRILYRLEIPSQVLTRTTSKSQRNVASQGALGDSPTVSAISVGSGEILFTGQFRGKYASLMNHEIEELFSAPGFESVPYYGDGVQTNEDGYYVLRDVDIGRSDPRDDRFQDFDGVMESKGTREEFYLSLRSEPVQVSRNDFGNATTANLAVPGDATQVMWFDSSSVSTESPTVVATAQTEAGSVDFVDPQNSSFSNPRLIYQLPYDAVSREDAAVWDTYGRTKFDSEGLRAWGRVFLPGHDFVGLPIVDTARLRLEFDTPGNTLSATRWNSSTSSWDAVALGTSDWQLSGLDVRGVTPTRIEARVGFEDSASSSTYAFQLLADRGKDRVQWLQPENTSEVAPSGLVSLLDPVASGSVLDVQPSRGLQARNEVHG